MSAPHFFATGVGLGPVALTGSEARHAARVLRIEPGEEITVADGRGHVVRARVIEVAREHVTADAFEERHVEQVRPTLTVWPAIAKNDKLDLVVQKLTELGVAAIRPWFAERSVVRWDAAKRVAHADRWRTIALAASKQSRRAWLPEVADPVDLVEPSEATVVLHETATMRLRTAVRSRVDGLALVVGPEGGLTEGEVDQMTAAGALAVTLGEQILRAETASIAGAAAVLTLAEGLA